MPEPAQPKNPQDAEGGRASSNCGTPLMPGDQVGEYVIVRQIGEGGFGTVYEATHPIIGKRAAVKLLHAQYSGDASMTSRFVAEARAVNQIRHKNIVDIFSFGDLPDGRHYYVMELLEGVPLDEYLDKVGRVPFGEALPILCAIGKALSAAHEAGIAHRDLKPENVFLEIDSDGLVHPKILDFGMAKLLSHGALPVHKTQSGAPLGSPRYMSPEQCRGVPIDSRTDVYAFGCIAYRMLSGLLPFEASTTLELMMAHVSAQPAPPSSREPALSRRFDEPILRMLEKLPEARPQTLSLALQGLIDAAKAEGVDVDMSRITLGTTFHELVTARRELAKSPPPTITPRSAVKSSPSRETKKRTLGAFKLGIVAVLGLLALWFVVRSTKPSVHADPVSPAPSSLAVNATLPSKPRGIETSTSQAIETTQVSSVQLTLQTTPVPAEVYLDSAHLGRTPGPFTLPRQDTPLTLELRAPGYTTQRLQFMPNVDEVRSVVLLAKPKKPKGRSTPEDLEDPY